MKDYSEFSITHLAAFIAKELSNAGLDVVIVGGLAVDIYTGNKYQTIDIDMIERGYKTEALNNAMSRLGFIKKGKRFFNSTTEYFIEFPSAPLRVGDEIIENASIVETEYGDIQVISVSDIIRDRLLAYLSWDDAPSLYQALCMMREHDKSIEEFKEFILKESNEKAYLTLKAWLLRVANLADVDMDAIEEALLDHVLAERISRH